MSEIKSNVAKLVPKDFALNVEVRWCPGCGDYAILTAFRKALANIGTVPEKVMCLSGIGCAARLPYYMSTNGLHTIHGRAPAFATGLALAKPDIDIWIITGDGDSMSIGIGHVIHMVRRNLPLRILLFNNAVYGLTKGQVSPTSPVGMISPSSPDGSRDKPVNPCQIVLNSGASFVARGADILQKELVSVMEACHHASEKMQRPAFVEIYQNCPVFNDGTFSSFLSRDNRKLNLLNLEKGEFLRFGEDMSKGLAIKDLKLVKVKADNDAIAKQNGVLRHDPQNFELASLLVRLKDPLPIGVIYDVSKHKDIQPPLKAKSMDILELKNISETELITKINSIISKVINIENLKLKD